jgi:hypothetical protein
MLGKRTWNIYIFPYAMLESIASNAAAVGGSPFSVSTVKSFGGALGEVTVAASTSARAERSVSPAASSP